MKRKHVKGRCCPKCGEGYPVICQNCGGLVHGEVVDDSYYYMDFDSDDDTTYDICIEKCEDCGYEYTYDILGETACIEFVEEEDFLYSEEDDDYV